MKNPFPRPRLVVSRCLNFDACRYNGDTVRSSFVECLVPFIEPVTVCPEVEIGMGVPRDPVRLVETGGRLTLKQPASGVDWTTKMTDFCESFIKKHPDVDGFLLKSRSPSCGIKDVKIYDDIESKRTMSKGAGFFGAAVQSAFAGLAIEDEGRLNNFRIREHFLIKLFTHARWRQLREDASMEALVRFHARHKHMLMAYNQTKLGEMGRVVANADKKSLESVLNSYEELLAEALIQQARFTSHINVLMHAMGYFSDQLSAAEKKHFLDVLERYRAGRVPLSQGIGIIQSWIARFKQDYLAEQCYFQPYPLELSDIADSGKGRGS